jgi:DNA (cytosine-5)-methyltransferase 1
MDIPMKESIKVGSQFSGVGAFEQALDRLNIEYDNVYAADWDKYARQTYLLNYKEPKFYVKDVYDTPMDEIPQLDIAMFSPPCQAFSLAGKRKGEDDDRGVLFYNSHEFIAKNKPRYFIFENVKGLLSDDGGKTFQRWIDFLGGKSVNGNPVIFPLEEATPYHVYYQVLNAKNYGIPQNRERIFIIGVRDDTDNDFSFPKPFHLVKRLKDVLESEVDEKYFLSDNNIKALMVYNERQIENNRGFSAKFREVETVEVMDALKCGGGGKDDLIKIGAIRGRNPEVGQPIKQTLEINETGMCNSLTTVQKGNVVVYSNEVIQLNPSTESGGKQPFQQNRVYDTCGVMTTLDTDSGRKSILNQQKIRRLTPRECFRLMDFSETFKWDVSDSQAYKQAGNSICVGVLSQIISKLNLKTNSLC